MVSENPFMRANAMIDAGKSEAGLDVIYETADDMMSEGRFGELDELIDGISLDDLTLLGLVGVMSATRAGKADLPARARFCAKVRAEHGEPEVLRGLY